MLALAALGAPAGAAIVNFAATIDGSQETPPIVTPAMASGTFVMDTTANTLSVNVIITAPPPSGETAAHIHGFAPPGVPAGILFGLPLGSPKIAVWNFLEAQEASTAGRRKLPVADPLSWQHPRDRRRRRSA